MSEEETTVQSSRRPETLEPRVAKLELGMERLTEDVKDLANVVRIQGQTVEQEIQKLVVAVTQASGPKKTDWGTIIAACGLILAIGGAAFWPLNQQVQELKAQQTAYHTSMVDHQKLDNHPVGAALVTRLEEQLKIHAQINEKEMQDHIAQATRDHETMRTHFHEEIEMLQKLTDAKLALAEAEAKGYQSKNDLYIDKLFGRVQILENERTKAADNEHAELMLWRQKAMGLSSSDSYVPLVPREQKQPPRPEPQK